MKRLMRNVPIRAAALAAVSILVLASGAPGMSRQPPEPPYAPGEILVKFHENVDSERAGEIVREEGGTVRRILERTGVYLIILPEGTDVMEAAERFSRHPEVRYAEPNYRARPLEER